MLDRRISVNQVKIYHVQGKKHCWGGFALFIYEQVSTPWWYFSCPQKQYLFKTMGTWDRIYAWIPYFYYWGLPLSLLPFASCQGSLNDYLEVANPFVQNTSISTESSSKDIQVHSNSFDSHDFFGFFLKSNCYTILYLFQVYNTFNIDIHYGMIHYTLWNDHHNKSQLPSITVQSQYNITVYILCIPTKHDDLFWQLAGHCYS